MPIKVPLDNNDWKTLDWKFVNLLLSNMMLE